MLSKYGGRLDTRADKSIIHQSRGPIQEHDTWNKKRRTLDAAHTRHLPGRQRDVIYVTQTRTFHALQENPPWTTHYPTE